MISKTSTTYVDANVLFDIILPGRKRYESAKRSVIGASSVAISTLSVHLCVHFASKVSLKISDVKKMLDNFEIFSLTLEDTDWAFNNVRDNDFEDALQIAVAIRNGCTRFITFDKKLYSTYNSLPTIEIELLK